MRLLCLILLALPLVLRTSGQDLLTFSKKSNPAKTFTIELYNEPVRIKPINEKAIRSVIVGFTDSVVSLRCQPREHRNRKENRARFLSFNLDQLSSAEQDSVYLVTIYSEAKLYHVSDLTRITIPMDKRA